MLTRDQLHRMAQKSTEKKTKQCKERIVTSIHDCANKGYFYVIFSYPLAQEVSIIEQLVKESGLSIEIFRERKTVTAVKVSWE